MTRSTSLVRAVVLLLGMAAAGGAAARDTGHLLRVSDVVEQLQRDGALDGVTFAFGGSSAGTGPTVTVDGLGRPYGPHGEPLPDDEATCSNALRDALGKLAARAREAHAHAVVGIVSNSFDRVYDNPLQVECHSGATHSAIALKGTLAEAAPSPPLAAAAPVDAFVDLPFSNPTPAAHGRVVPPASGFADAADLDAAPLEPEQRGLYRDYRTLRTPKAFAIDEQGRGHYVEHARDAMARVLDRCAQEHVRCWLYAVDDRVVWQSDVDKRIGLSSQLGDERLLRPRAGPPIPTARPRS
jgi:hypothetical protein